MNHNSIFEMDKTTSPCQLIALITTLIMPLTWRSVLAVIQGTEQLTEPSLWPYNDDTTGQQLSRASTLAVLNVNMAVWDQQQTTAILHLESASLHFVDSGDAYYTHLFAWDGELLELDSNNNLAGYNFEVYVDTLSDAAMTAKAKSDVITAFGDVEPHSSFTPDEIFVITFEDVTWQGNDPPSSTNTIQLVFLVDNAHRKTYVEYDYGHIEWHGSDEANPKLKIGASKYSGICPDDSFHYEIPWTTTAELTNQIQQGNTNLDKRWIFPLYTFCTTSDCVCSSCPCVNGDCEPVESGFMCTCDSGYTGATCEVNIDDCAGVDCGDGACVDAVGTYSCQCCAGYDGSMCQNNIDDCVGVTCEHGSCLDFVANNTCQCDDGYSGATCSVTTTHCTSQPCQHGGTCKETPCLYSCDCPDGVTGVDCETDTRPAVGTFDSWGSWSSCSKTCDYGFRTTYRQCLRQPCQDINQMVEICSASNCNVDATETSEALTMTMYKSMLQIATSEDDLKTFVAVQLNNYCAARAQECCALAGTAPSGQVTSIFAVGDVVIAKGYPKPVTTVQAEVLFYVAVSRSGLIQRCTTSVRKRAADPNVVTVPKSLLLTALGQQLGDNNEQTFCCATIGNESSSSNDLTQSDFVNIITGTTVACVIIIIILLALTIYYAMRRNDNKMGKQHTGQLNGLRMTPRYLFQTGSQI